MLKVAKWEIPQHQHVLQSNQPNNANKTLKLDLLFTILASFLNIEVSLASEGDNSLHSDLLITLASPRNDYNIDSYYPGNHYFLHATPLLLPI